MATCKRKKIDIEALAEAPKGGNNPVPTSSLYDLTIKAAFVDVAPWGDQTLSLVIEKDGSTKTLYSCLNLGPESMDGQEAWKVEMVDKAWATFDHLCIACGIDPEDVTDTETIALPIGKGGKDVDSEVFTQFEDTQVKLWIKQEYYVSKKGDIGDNLILKEAFTIEGLSGDEILREETEPVRLGKITIYTEAVKYGNDLTAEAIDAWIAADRPAGTGTAGATAAPARKKVSFGKK